MVDVSKLTGYAAVTSTGPQASKVTGYAVAKPPGPQVSKLVGYVVFRPPSQVLMPLMVAEPLTGGDNSNIQSPLVLAEPLTGGNSVVQMNLNVVEVLTVVIEDPEVATQLLPTGSAIGAPLSSTGLRGIAWSTFKRPMFRTQVNEIVSGRENRNARMQYPIYKFELTYEFLDERDGNTDLETMMGFFMNQKGKYGEWLYQDPSDYIAQGVQLGVGDGDEAEFYALKQIGTFRDPIGQFDQSDLFSFLGSSINTGTDQVTVTGHNLATGFGPFQFTSTDTLPAGLSADTNYWLIVIDENTVRFATSYTNALSGTYVDITDIGVGTTTAANSVAVYLDGVELATSEYIVTLPNTIVFTEAPAADVVITYDTKYYFICRFMADEHDYEQFMYNLWTLESMEFQSVIK